MKKVNENCDIPTDDDYCQMMSYDTTGGCTIKNLWVDCHNSIWIESNDGQKICIPWEYRRLLSKRIKELTFR